ncbi:hypothetical protein AGLY_007715 [Aphis glycines]|uniref:Uncharacterized protein n=1 Tax=Aphis glycines TaxID=307491 RepID=A0A6G0TNP0_APHGL|nr:hypothetical protein AGLY_007715 [Aphis glycines]
MLMAWAMVLGHKMSPSYKTFNSCKYLTIYPVKTNCLLFIQKPLKRKGEGGRVYAPQTSPKASLIELIGGFERISFRVLYARIEYRSIMAAQFIESERGNKLLVLNNFKFSKVNRPLASGLTKYKTKDSKPELVFDYFEVFLLSLKPSDHRLTHIHSSRFDYFDSFIGVQGLVNLMRFQKSL